MTDRKLRFREDEWLEKGAQLQERRCVHLKPLPFAPDSAPGKEVPRSPSHSPPRDCVGQFPSGRLRGEGGRRSSGRAGNRGGVAALRRKGKVRHLFPGALVASLRCSMGPLPRTVELFYDVLSPYSWLGFEVTPRLRRRGQREGRTQDIEPTVSCSSWRCRKGFRIGR